MIGRLFPVGEEMALKRVNKSWKELMAKAAKQRKSISLTNFPEPRYEGERPFHTIDSFVAFLLNIKREDVLGPRLKNLYTVRDDGSVEENQGNIRNLFSWYTHLQNIQLEYLTDFVLQEINERYREDEVDESKKHLKSLAFHRLADKDICFSNYQNLAANLRILVYGIESDDEFVSRTCSEFKILRNITFNSPVDTRPGYEISLLSLANIPETVRELNFGTRGVSFGENSEDLVTIVSNSNLKDITHLEILNPVQLNFDQYVERVLPLHEKMISLVLNISRVSDHVSLSTSLPDLKSLALIVDTDIRFADMIGDRPNLQHLRIAGILQNECRYKYIAHFTLKTIEEIVACAPNLLYFCVLPFETGADFDLRLMTRYVMILSRLTCVQEIHLPHTPYDYEIVKLLQDIKSLRRVEFVGPVVQEVADRAFRVKEEMKLKFEIDYQDRDHYCVCAYSQTGRRRKRL